MHPAILMELPNERRLLNGFRFRYKAVSTWLQHLLLDAALPPEALETDIKYFQSSAEFSAELFQLAVAVHPRTFHPVIKAFDSPASLWFAIEYLGSQYMLATSGLLGSAKIEGKRELTNKLIQELDKLANLELPPPKALHLLTVEESARLAYTLPGASLLVAAALLAKADPEFDSVYYRKFIKSQKRYVNKWRNCKEVPMVWLNPKTGELVSTAKHKKLPRRL